jgi:hypothetical protein
MLETRRRKKRAMKDLAREYKLAKKQAKQKTKSRAQ